MRNFTFTLVVATIVSAAALATSAPANAGWGSGWGYDNAAYRDLSARYLGYRWGFYGWSWGPIRYRPSSSFYSYGYSPYAAPGCGC